MKEKIKNLLTLIKIRIAVATGISSTVGYILASDTIGLSIFGAFFGGFFLAAGAASLNQIQEWKYDSLMKRTKNRPIPTHFFSVKEAVPFSISFFIFGFGIIFLSTSSLIPPLIGLSAFILYNGFYTPLKRKTPFATIPGALIGVIPPILGWSLVSTDFYSSQLIALLTFLFIWQIPHFYFLLFIFEDDYRNAGFPVLTDKFSKSQIAAFSYGWILLLVLVSSLLILTDVHFNFWVLSFYLLAGVLLLFRIRKLMFFEKTSRNYRLAFMQLNIYVLLVLFTISINRFIL